MSDLFDRLNVDTPDNILLEAEVAGFGSRCVAAILDYTVLAILYIFFLFSIARSLSGLTFNGGLALIVLTQFILITFYHLVFELLWNGQTPGKRWTGIRVMRSNGLPLTPSATIIRNLVRLFDYLPIFYAIGLLVMLFSPRTQRLGDYAAGTVVIRERTQLTTANLKQEVALQYAFTAPNEEIPAYIQLSALSPSDLQVIRNFLIRRGGMINRETLGVDLAFKYAQQMNIESYPLRFGSASQGSNNAERFLEHIMRAVDRANAGI
ncbi:MAG: RDD family protein [Anaerolineae bacterium]|nr:RDD family protein [Anaerolineae bacterium]